VEETKEDPKRKRLKRLLLRWRTRRRPLSSIVDRKTEATTETKPWTKEEEAMTNIIRYFESHFDKNTLSATMFSLSSKDAFVYYYTKDGCVVEICQATHSTAGFSIVVKTTEIHSGPKDLNGHKLKNSFSP
jgi:hypothetical protein